MRRTGIAAHSARHDRARAAGRRTPHVHLFSDSTGETLHAVARVALAWFARAAPSLRDSVLCRTDADMAAVIDQLERHPGAVLYTVADPRRRAQLLEVCRRVDVTAISVLDPVTAALSERLREPPSDRAGLQHRVSSEYFTRMAALDFETAHDDGALGHHLLQADVILTGALRTSKTPTCIYLAYRGIKAANVPLPPKAEQGPALVAAMREGVPVMDLTASPTRLGRIRSQRLEAMGGGHAPHYSDLDRSKSPMCGFSSTGTRSRSSTSPCDRSRKRRPPSSLSCAVAAVRTG